MFFVMATLAQRTTRIAIGSHVACMLFRHPAMHARLFAQLDEASGGRVIAGVGAGWTRAEFVMMGIEFPDVSDRLRIMDEAVTVMRGLWRDEPFTFAGRYFQVTDAVCTPRPVQKPGPPLMLGGSGNGILRRAGAWADIIHMVPVIGAAGTTTLDEIRKFDDAGLPERLARVRAAEAKAGRPSGSVRFASTIFTYAPTDSATRTRELAEGLGNVFGLPADALRRHPIALVGTPDEMIEELRRREREHGLSLLALNFTSLEQQRDFGARVLPHVR
jgi:alkanesulfonate monooxygenase SsuD/methylene tetrahydromethanopterin reductase-like flavin-dependent oxidoreductase (luciferase family)